MTAAPSQKAREGATPTNLSVTARRTTQIASRDRYCQGTEYEEPGRSELTPTLGADTKTIRIVSGPVSLMRARFAAW